MRQKHHYLVLLTQHTILPLGRLAVYQIRQANLRIHDMTMIGGQIWTMYFWSILMRTGNGLRLLMVQLTSGAIRRHVKLSTSIPIC